MISKFRTLGLAAAILMLGGCILISGTFVIVSGFSFTTHNGFYYYDIDITEEQEWKDHKEDIDDVDLVGFEMWFVNDETSDVTFSVYIDGPDEPVYSNFDDVDDNAYRVLNGITLPASSTSHLTYAESFAYVENVADMKRLVEGGQFHYYGVSSGGTSSGYRVDSGKVIVTFSASK